MTAMRVKRVRRLWQVMGALAVEVAQGDCPALTVAPVQTIAIQRRSWPVRFVRNYLDWREYRGIVGALRAAWNITRAQGRDAAALASQPRLGREQLDISGGNLSQG